MVNNNIIIKDARIGFRNFTGKEGQFNPPGRRNFCVFLDHAFGQELEREGWNIKWTKPREEGDEETPYMQVSVSFDNIPPRVVLVTSNGKTPLTPETISMLDYAEIQKVDLSIRPYNWQVGGKSGVKAYVKSMFVTVVEDEFESDYYDVPEIDR